jgi:hypothetical protein
MVQRSEKGRKKACMSGHIIQNRSASSQPRAYLILVSDVSDDMKMVTVVYVLSKLIFSQHRDRNGNAAKLPV